MNRLDVCVHPNLVYGRCDGTLLTFDHYHPANPTGAAVVFVNSGGFESGKLIQYVEKAPGSYRFLASTELTIQASEPIPALAQFSFEPLLGEGFSVFDVKHRNAPHTLDQMLEDVRTAIRWIDEYASQLAIDPARIGIFGASSGGYLAIAAALTAKIGDTHAIRAIATYYPAGYDFPADVAGFPQIREGIPALNVDDNVLESHSIKNLYQAGGPPTLLIYGDQDFPFILTSCHSICSEFPKAGIKTECVVIQGAAHEFMREDGYRPEDGRRAQEMVVRWFTQQLGK